MYTYRQAQRSILLRSAHTVYLSFMWISEQTAIISLNNINWLVFTREAESVHCAVRAGSSTILQIRPLFTANSIHNIYFIYVYLFIYKAGTFVHTPTCLWRWNRQSVRKPRHINFRRRGITQKKAYNIQNTVKVWNQEDVGSYWMTLRTGEDTLIWRRKL
jgi:hypothetical protein